MDLIKFTVNFKVMNKKDDMASFWLSLKIANNSQQQSITTVPRLR